MNHDSVMKHLYEMMSCWAYLACVTDAESCSVIVHVLVSPYCNLNVYGFHLS